MNRVSQVNQLSKIEALVFLNRWAKKDDLYYDDVKMLYRIKHQLVAGFCKFGVLIPTQIIQRSNPVFLKMAEEIKGNGSHLLLNYQQNYHDYLDNTELQHYQLLLDFINGEVKEDLPESVVEQIQQEYQKKLAEYKKVQKAYSIETERRKTILLQYQEQLAVYIERKKEAALNWARENNINIVTSSDKKARKKKWVKYLEKQGFNYPEAPPINPLPTHKPPRQPPFPVLSIAITPSNYQPGINSELDAALLWGNNMITQYFNQLNTVQEIYGTDMYLIEAVDSFVLAQVRVEVIKCFSDIVEGKIKDPYEIWRLLTSYPIDYFYAIGMCCYDEFNRYSHKYKDFGNWHSINLSATGFWLVEFACPLNYDIVFHVPYDVVDEKYRSLPSQDTESEQEQYGREITEAEQQLYPIVELVEYLGFSLEHFPHRLSTYVSSRSYYYEDDEDEDYDYYDDDEEDF